MAANYCLKLLARQKKYKGTEETQRESPKPDCRWGEDWEIKGSGADNETGNSWPNVNREQV